MSSKGYEKYLNEHKMSFAQPDESGEYVPVHVQESVMKYVPEDVFIDALYARFKDLKFKTDVWDTATCVEAHCRFRGYGDYKKHTAKQVAEIFNFPAKRIYKRLEEFNDVPTIMFEHIVLVCTYQKQRCRVLDQHHWGVKLKTPSNVIEVPLFGLTKFEVIDADPYPHIVDPFSLLSPMEKMCELLEKTYDYVELKKKNNGKGKKDSVIKL